MTRRAKQCEAIRKDLGYRCRNRGWILRGTHLVCGQHRYSTNIRFVERPKAKSETAAPNSGTIDACPSCSESALSPPLDVSDE